MNWAKTSAHCPYNLATSGMMSYPLHDLHVNIDDLEINPPGGYGYKPLIHQLAAKCGVADECVVTAAGTSMANHLAMAAILEPGDEILIEQPTYGLLLDVAHYLRAAVRRFPRGFDRGFQIDLDALRQAISPKTKLVVLTNLHNPSGVYTDPEILKQINEIASRNGTRVLADEVYLETFFKNIPTSFTEESQFVVTSSLTKAYGLSGLRCGWILADPALARKMWRLNDLFAATGAHPAERLSVIALQKLHQVAERAENLLNTNRPLLHNFLRNEPRLECVIPDHGTIAFPKLLSGSVDKLCEVLESKYETGVVPGRFFEMPDHFRMGIAVETEILNEGLNRIHEALKAF